MKKKSILKMLEGGDRRSIGRADQAAKMVEMNPRLFDELLNGLWSVDARVRMRAADATEKVTRKRPELLGLLRETK